MVKMPQNSLCADQIEANWDANKTASKKKKKKFPQREKENNLNSKIILHFDSWLQWN